MDGSSDQTLCTPIPIRDDMVLEGDHAFTVAIVGAGTSPHAEVGSPSSTTVTIKDDESRSFLLGTKYTIYAICIPIFKPAYSRVACCLSASDQLSWGLYQSVGRRSI